MSRITAFCRISPDGCFVNGNVFLERDENASDNWYRQIYKYLDLSYPKFYKMDLLSQTGFLMTEMIKSVAPSLTSGYQDDEIALLFGNSRSSAETDQRFEKSYQAAGSPSPALFVYTLPNIVMGEIAIFNKWYGENMFVVLPKFAPDFFVSYNEILLSTGAKAVLSAWLEVTDGQTDAFMFLVESQSRNGEDLTEAVLTAMVNSNID